MHVTTPPGALADEYVSRLVSACEQMGYNVHVHKPSTRLTVFLPHAGPYTNETVTLKTTEDDDLCWFWSWGARMVEAEKIGEAAHMIATVVQG